MPLKRAVSDDGAAIGAGAARKCPSCPRDGNARTGVRAPPRYIRPGHAGANLAVMAGSAKTAYLDGTAMDADGGNQWKDQ